MFFTPKCPQPKDNANPPLPQIEPDVLAFGHLGLQGNEVAQEITQAKDVLVPTPEDGPNLPTPPVQLPRDVPSNHPPPSVPSEEV